MSEDERALIGDFVQKEFGIKMPPSKKSLLEGRLGRRLAACGVSSFGEYFRLVTDATRGRDEMLVFADLVSTHETSFFREPRHFEFLKDVALPSLAAKNHGELSLLSAACSTGEEAYTMAFVAESALTDALGARPYLVEGVDLSERAVAMAHRGVYTAERVAKVSPLVVQRFFMTSKDRSRKLVRVVPEVRAKTWFHTGNLLGDPGWADRQFDVIFCRNVLIYFDRATQRRVLLSLLRHLKPTGYLFVGHSESLVNLDLPVKAAGHAVFQKLERRGAV